MTESQPVLKRQKSDYDLGRDMLSDLPLSIIHTILSSLPIKDAVRTSILSRKWRYTWTGLPKLEFISNAEGNKDERRASEERLKEFITYALSVHQGPLHTNMDEWLIRLSTKDIRELIAEFRSLLSVHSSIYSCSKLTRLYLDLCNVGPPPSTFKGFSFLRNLTLHMVRISNATAENLVSNSPCLESLELYRLGRDENDTMIRIHAPKLKYLHLQGFWTELSMNAPLVSEIKVVVLDANELQRGPFCNYTNFLGGCTNLEKLTGFCQFTQVMSIGMESWNHNPLVFHRLTTVVLFHVDFRDVKQQSVLARLLVGAPNLQKHSIAQAKFSLETQDVHFSSFGFKPNFRMEKLRFVGIGSVRGLLPEMKLIEFLLERSPLLETMTVLLFQLLGAKEIIDLTCKLLGYTRASQTANISVSAGAISELL